MTHQAWFDTVPSTLNTAVCHRDPDTEPTRTALPEALPARKELGGTKALNHRPQEIDHSRPGSTP